MIIWPKISSLKDIYRTDSYGLCKSICLFSSPSCISVRSGVYRIPAFAGQKEIHTITQWKASPWGDEHRYSSYTTTHTNGNVKPAASHPPEELVFGRERGGWGPSKYWVNVQCLHIAGARWYTGDQSSQSHVWKGLKGMYWWKRPAVNRILRVNALYHDTESLPAPVITETYKD